MSDERKIEQRLRRLAVPAPGELVRSRALAAAREAFGAQPAPDIWDRIWFSPRFRLAWAAVVSLLVAGHILVPTEGPGVTGQGSMEPRYVERMLGPDADPELVAGLELPPLDRTATSGEAAEAVFDE